VVLRSISSTVVARITNEKRKDMQHAREKTVKEFEVLAKREVK
jgi:hypothetical protein